MIFVCITIMKNNNRNYKLVQLHMVGISFLAAMFYYNDTKVFAANVPLAAKYPLPPKLANIAKTISCVI